MTEQSTDEDEPAGLDQDDLDETLLAPEQSTDEDEPAGLTQDDADETLQGSPSAEASCVQDSAEARNRLADSQ